jgi:mono/diheme cytochrome c family protein
VSEVTAQLKAWVAKLDKNDPRLEHHLLEALWVSWGINKVDQPLLRQLLSAKDYRVRAAAVRVLRYSGHQVSDQAKLLMQAAKDVHGRVRLEAIVAAAWLDKETGIPIVNEAAKLPLDEWMADAHETALAHLNGRSVVEKKEEVTQTSLSGNVLELYKKGKAIYSREGYCNTCHQPDGMGLSASGFPPLAGTPWVSGSDERLIKLVLNGLHGPIEVLGQKYGGQVPMTPFGGLLNDEEVAAVITYVRNSFGNKASVVSAEQVTKVRAATKNKSGFYSPEDLLKLHPMEND